MIKNEREYKIAKSTAVRFERELNARATAEVRAAEAAIHPRLLEAEREALQSQLDELKSDIAAYEALRSGYARALEVESLADLPKALIQGRIALGLTQRELAERLGTSEQQIQRYEATDYSGANLGRIVSVANALNLRIPDSLSLPPSSVSGRDLLRRLSQVGIDKALVRKVLPLTEDEIAEVMSGKGPSASGLLRIGDAMHRIFGWPSSELWGEAPLSLDTRPLAAASFKLPASARGHKLHAYTVYAHYLALLALDATWSLKPAKLVSDARCVREDISREYGDVTLSSALSYAWSRGICVLPLRDAGSFHGACWRISGRPVVILKQRTNSPARWLHDLLHEYHHLATETSDKDLDVIEIDDLLTGARSSPREEAATRFASEVVLDGRSEELAQECVQVADGKVECLKGVVPKVAKRAGVPSGALANYLAFRLSLQGIDWWGAAINLQEKGDPWTMVRDEFLMRTSCEELAETDTRLLRKALESTFASQGEEN